MAGDAELARGWQALGMSAWVDAREAFQAALDREETPEALEGLGSRPGGWATPAPRSPCASGPPRLPASRRRRGRGQGGDRAGPGPAHLPGQPAVASGWLQRAR